MMVAMSIGALVLCALFGLFAVLDQTKRIHDPVKYAEARCRNTSQPAASTSQVASCISKEEKKSTLASVAPLLVVGIAVGVLGVAGLVVGRQEVERYDDLMRKLKDED